MYMVFTLEESKKIIDRFDANLKTKKHLYNLEISNTNTNPLVQV